MNARRRFLRQAAWAAGGAMVAPSLLLGKGKTDELGHEVSSYKDITQYNNFFEFTFDKTGIDTAAKNFRTSPWEVSFEGLIEKPVVMGLEEIMKRFPSQEHIYRMRCVEGWSRVVPWDGFPLKDLIAYLKPLSSAKYVEMESYYDPKVMPKQKLAVYPWPYREGLRMDEAMHPLTLMATGVMGKPLLVQNGAPFRLVVPWKYGYKGIKSVVKIKFVEEMPQSFWMKVTPSEYGFYANVNPNVPHPRWSQERERVLGSFFRRDTMMFNGYEKQVAHLYKGLDLKKFY